MLELDLSVSSECDSPESMLRVPSPLCWEWSLAGLRSGLSADALSHVITSSAALRDIRFSWGGYDVIADVLASIATCAHLTRLDLADSSLDNHCLPALSQILHTAHALTHLDLCANELLGTRASS